MTKAKQVERPLKDVLKECETKGPNRLRVFFDDGEDWYWVGTQEIGSFYRQEFRLAEGMRKDVAELVLEALLKERNE